MRHFVELLLAQYLTTLYIVYISTINTFILTVTNINIEKILAFVNVYFVHLSIIQFIDGCIRCIFRIF